MLIYLWNIKKFLIIGNKNAITYKEFFPLLKDDEVWIGCTNVKGFLHSYSSIKKFGNIGWFTNFDVTNRHEKRILWKKYMPEGYPNFDNYQEINVNKVSENLVDYDGIMGVPITYLGKHNYERFEMLCIICRDEYRIKLYDAEHYAKANDLNVYYTMENLKCCMEEI